MAIAFDFRCRLPAPPLWPSHACCEVARDRRLISDLTPAERASSLSMKVNVSSWKKSHLFSSTICKQR